MTKGDGTKKSVGAGKKRLDGRWGGSRSLGL